MAMMLDGRRAAPKKSSPKPPPGFLDSLIKKPAPKKNPPAPGGLLDSLIKAPPKPGQNGWSVTLDPRDDPARVPTYSGGGKRATAPKAATLSSMTTSTTSGTSEADAYARAQAEAEAKARQAANNAARERAMSDLERLNAGISANQAKKNTNVNALDALKNLVGSGPGSHASVRDNALAALDQALKVKLEQLTATFETSMADFTKNLRDNESSEHDSTFANFANRAREKQDLVTQALSQGAGESDLLRAQLQALRNWSANQGDVNRSFFDTRTSINSGITDLNNQTLTGRKNEEQAANAARGKTWDEFYEGMGNTYSDMANLDQSNYLLDAEIGSLEGQKGNVTGLLKWLDEGKNAEDWKPATPKTLAAPAPPKFTSEYAKLASEMAGSTWQDPGLSEETKNWQGGQLSEGGLNTAQPWDTQATPGSKKRRPEGATLRRW